MHGVLAVLRAATVMALCAYGAAGAQPPGPAQAGLEARLAQAQTDARLAESLLKTGRKAAAFCANCHGDSGNSIKPEVPNLAGQNTAYLLEQLQQFADGRRRDTFMQSMIHAMSADEKVGAVLFYAGQKVTPRPPPPETLLATGRDVFAKVCVRCHGNEGRGDHKIARIAGQQPEYLSLTLKRYRGGSGQRTDPLMSSNTRLLSDGQIEAVVAYVSAMR